MIEYVRGILDELTPAQAVVECSGVGYLLNISLNTYTAIQGKSNVRLFVYEVIREDSYVLYGFESKAEREMFTMLISVSGIGGNTARTILSAFSLNELCDVIMTGNERMLKTVKGLGVKTAQRVIVELKDLFPERLMQRWLLCILKYTMRLSKRLRCLDSHQLL